MWSKLIGDTLYSLTSIEVIAKDRYDGNNLAYHNWRHILSCYDYLEINNVPYDEDLDWAVMHHDIVYDELDCKELRSAQWVEKMYPKRTGVFDIIIATADHNITGRSWQCVEMIKADLHQLATPALVLANYVKMLDESTKLYKIPDKVFAAANLDYMLKLRDTIYNNVKIKDLDPFWNNVLDGIDFTIHISEGFKKALHY